jgi:hypothetical protein
LLGSVAGGFFTVRADLARERMNDRAGLFPFLFGCLIGRPELLDRLLVALGRKRPPAGDG